MAEAKLAAAFENISVFSVNENELFFFFIANISSKIQKFECFFFSLPQETTTFLRYLLFKSPTIHPRQIKRDVNTPNFTI